MRLEASVFCFVVSALAAPASAQDYCPQPEAEGGGTASLTRTCVLQTIEVTGLRPSDARTVAASVTRLNEDDLIVRNSPNVADVLRSVPGVAVSRSGGVGALTQVRIRGAEANHTLVLFDGIDVSDPVNGETDFGLLTSLPGARIDVLRGAASSIHGTDAIGGVVAISSPNVTDTFNANIEGGSRETLQARLAASNQALSGALSAFSTGGVDTSGLGGEDDGSQAYSGFLKASADFSEWTVSGFALARRSLAEIDNDRNFDGRLENSASETEADQYLIGAGLDGKTGAIDHRVRASFNEVSRDNFLADDLQDASTGKRTQVTWSPALTRDRQTMAGLVAFRRETYDRSDVQFGGFTDASEAFESVSLAAQYGVDFGDLDLQASVRHDLNDGRFDDATAWRGGAAYQFTPIRAQLRASVATGIKNPTFTELFGFFPGSFIGNPDLRPEEALSVEIGWDQHLFVDAVHYSVTAFSADLKNEIFNAFNPNFTATARNRDEDSARAGIELAARWKLDDHFFLNAQISQVKSENDSDEKEIRVPETTASLGGLWKPTMARV